MEKKIFGISLGGTGWTSGCENAPNVIKLLIDNYCPDLYNIAKYHSIYFDPGISTEKKLKKIYDKYSELVKNNEKVLSLGGDHLISFPIVKKLSENIGKFKYVYLDAHLDLFDDTPYYNWNVARKIKDLGIDVFNIGFRNFIDEKKFNCIENIPINFEFNSKIISDKIKQMLGNKDEKIYLSIDLDILDPLIFPYVNSPVSCGLLPRELFFIIKELVANYSIIGIDINEYNPINDHQNTGNHFIRFIIDYILNKWE